MYGLRKILEEEEKRLIELMKKVDEEIQKSPEGKLRLTSSGKHVQYMHCIEGEEWERHQGIYIKKENHSLAQGLAQKEYDQKVQKLVKKRLYQIQMMLNNYSDDEIEKIYLAQHPVRQSLITPVEKTWEQRLAEWKAIPYEGRGFDPNDPEIYTKLNERVRSKSEKLLANGFHDLGIVYKYECPLFLKGYGTVYPDFTFLDKYSYEEIYWEHDGRMGDPQYAEKAIRKINSYIQNGILPGKRLILTFESSNCILNDKVVEQLIREHLMK